MRVVSFGGFLKRAPWPSPLSCALGKSPRSTHESQGFTENPCEEKAVEAGAESLLLSCLLRLGLSGAADGAADAAAFLAGDEGVSFLPREKAASPQHLRQQVEAQTSFNAAKGPAESVARGAQAEKRVSDQRIRGSLGEAPSQRAESVGKEGKGGLSQRGKDSALTNAAAALLIRAAKKGALDFQTPRASAAGAEREEQSGEKVSRDVANGAGCDAGTQPFARGLFFRRARGRRCASHELRQQTKAKSPLQVKDPPHGTGSPRQASGCLCQGAKVGGGREGAKATRTLLLLRISAARRRRTTGRLRSLRRQHLPKFSPLPLQDAETLGSPLTDSQQSRLRLSRHRRIDSRDVHAMTNSPTRRPPRDKQFCSVF